MERGEEKGKKKMEECCSICNFHLVGNIKEKRARYDAGPLIVRHGNNKVCMESQYEQYAMTIALRGFQLGSEEMS